MKGLLRDKINPGDRCGICLRTEEHSPRCPKHSTNKSAPALPPDLTGELVEDLAEELQQVQQELHYVSEHLGTFDVCGKGRCVQTRALLARAKEEGR